MFAPSYHLEWVLGDDIEIVFTPGRVGRVIHILVWLLVFAVFFEIVSWMVGRWGQ